MHCRFLVYTFFTLACSFMISCDNNEEIPDPNEDMTLPTNQLEGAGSFVFDEFQPLNNKPVTVYYHVPATVEDNSPILIVLHGGSRDAQANRDEMIANANRKGVIVVVPEFSSTYFPGGDQYNLGNIFVDGDNPTANTLNPEDQWTFSLIEPIFDQIQRLTANKTQTYYLFGFSAGAQFLHRFLFFKPNARVQETVAAASGWYTLLDGQIAFPYGIKDTPFTNQHLETTCNQKLTILIGEEDNNPNAGGLRRNAQADAQGTNRLSRAQYFFNESRQIANGNNFTFAWQYVSLPRVGHDFAALSDYAMNTTFNF